MIKNIMINIKQFIIKLNDYGIPLPLFRIEGKPTLTGTLTIISFLVAILGQIGKISGWVGGVDDNTSIYILVTTLSAYLGRRMQGSVATKTVTVDSADSKQ